MCMMMRLASVVHKSPCGSLALESFLSLCAASAAKALSRSVERKNFFEDDTDGDDDPPLFPEVGATTLRSALLLPKRRKWYNNFSDLKTVFCCNEKKMKEEALKT